MKRKNVILMLRREVIRSPEVRKSGSPEVQKSSHYNEELPCDP